MNSFMCIHNAENGKNNGIVSTFYDGWEAIKNGLNHYKQHEESVVNLDGNEIFSYKMFVKLLKNLIDKTLLCDELLFYNIYIEASGPKWVNSNYI